MNKDTVTWRILRIAIRALLLLAVSGLVMLRPDITGNVLSRSASVILGHPLLSIRPLQENIVFGQDLEFLCSLANSGRAPIFACIIEPSVMSRNPSELTIDLSIESFPPREFDCVYYWLPFKPVRIDPGQTYIWKLKVPAPLVQSWVTFSRMGTQSSITWFTGQVTAKARAAYVRSSVMSGWTGYLNKCTQVWMQATCKLQVGTPPPGKKAYQVFAGSSRETITSEAGLKYTSHPIVVLEQHVLPQGFVNSR